MSTDASRVMPLGRHLPRLLVSPDLLRSGIIDATASEMLQTG
jgi:hypothetical protein